MKILKDNELQKYLDEMYQFWVYGMTRNCDYCDYCAERKTLQDSQDALDSKEAK